jgi:outer membrane biosynthesis protein TonB
VALEVPPVPPRVIDLAPVEPPPIPLVEDLATPTPSSPTPPKPRPQARDANRTEPKPEAKPEAPEPDPVPPPAPVAPLRTGTSANGPEAERQIREIIGRANRLLETVDVRSLSDERRANFDSAKDSIKRADEAIKASNWVLARQIAERAENIAKLLISRQFPD